MDSIFKNYCWRNRRRSKGGWGGSGLKINQAISPHGKKKITAIKTSTGDLPLSSASLIAQLPTFQMIRRKRPIATAGIKYNRNSSIEMM